MLSPIAPFVPAWKPSRSAVGLLIAGAMLFGGLHLALLPANVVVFNDDFGYLRSVLETDARGRPWTDDWLAPWNASLSVLSAAVFRLTGSFMVATQGLQVACMMAGLGALAVLLCRRGVEPLFALVLAALALTTPTVLWKQIEFTALALYLPCLLLAVLCAEARRWGGVALAVGLAVASRQSAVGWLAVPGFALLCSLGRGWGRWREVGWGPLWPIGAAVAVFVGATVGMNSTHAQEVMLPPLAQTVRAGHLLHWLAYGVGIMVASAGVARALLWLWGRGAAPAGFQRWGIVPALALVLGFLWRGRFDLQIEHALFATEAGRVYGGLLLAGAVGGWCLCPSRLDPGLLLGGLGCALLPGLRSEVWEYYLLDAAAFAFLSVHPLPAGEGRAGEGRWACRARAVVAPVAMLALLACHASFLRLTHIASDNSRALLVASERALRAGRIRVDELSLVSFGYLGWQLYPHFIAHEGKGPVYIANFTLYLKPGALELEVRHASDRRPLERAEAIVADEVFRIGWRERHRFILRRRETVGPAPQALDWASYERPVFPLDDAEWRQHAAALARRRRSP